MVEKLRPTYTFTEDRLDQLKAVVPEAFADGKINWDVIREALGEHLEDEDSERFGLFWPGKREARRLASKPSKGTLFPLTGEGVNEENTHNIFIEGENLEVLKILLKSYANQVRMIYIDPPYNTGNDFIYSDNFSDQINTYLRRTGELGESEELLTSNSRASGRFHSNWLNMMYPRLLLAHQFLSEDGMIMVSIDDSEIYNLRIILNEIFGEENFIDSIIWKKRYGGGSKEKYLVSLHEYILFYAKNVQYLDPISIPLSQESIERYYKLTDENFEIRGPYRTHPLEATKSMGARPNLVFPIIAPDGSQVLPKRQWLWSKERLDKALAGGEIEFIKSRDGSWTVHTKQYLRDQNGQMRETKAFSIIDDVYTQHGTNEIISDFGDAQVFPFAKPTDLIKRLIELGTVPDQENIILDFFAGSGSAALAVLRKNAEDGGSRKFILIQMPEQVPLEIQESYPNLTAISEICKERIRKYLHRLEREFPDAMNPKFNKPSWGFKVFKLNKSHFINWESYIGEDVREYQLMLGEMTESPLISEWVKEDLLIEILLQQGFPLESSVNTKEFGKNQVYIINTEFLEYSLHICLDQDISFESIEKISDLPKEDVFVCLDSALTDEIKAQIDDEINLVVI